MLIGRQTLLPVRDLAGGCKKEPVIYCQSILNKNTRWCRLGLLLEVHFDYPPRSRHMREAPDELFCHLEIHISSHKISLPIPAIKPNHQIFRREKTFKLLFNPPRDSIRRVAILHPDVILAAGRPGCPSPVDASVAAQQRVEELV